MRSKVNLVYNNYFTEQCQHWNTAGHMKHRQCVLLMMLVFCLACTGCPQKRVFISLTPIPVIVREGDATFATIQCTAVIHSTDLKVMKMGILSNGRILGIAATSLGSKPQYFRRAEFEPDGTTSLSGNETCLSVLLVLASIKDLTHTWACHSDYGPPSFCEQSDTGVFEAVPYPGNTSLTASPARNSYDYDDTVSLNCRANFSLKGKTNSIKANFQYYNHSQWLDVNVTDRQKYKGLTVSASVPKGDFIERAYSLSVRVSGIPSCSRRFRCLLTYGTHVFNDTIPEREVKVIPCRHPVAPTTPRPTTVAPTTPRLRSTDRSTDVLPRTSRPTPVVSLSTAGPLRPTVSTGQADHKNHTTGFITTGPKTHTTATSDQYNDDTEDKKASSEDNGLLSKGLIVGLLVIILATVVIILVRRRRYHSGVHSRVIHGLSQERIQAVTPRRRSSVSNHPSYHPSTSQGPTSYSSTISQDPTSSHSSFLATTSSNRDDELGSEAGSVV